MFGHEASDIESEEELITDVENETDMEDTPLKENQCHLCIKQLSNRDELNDHVKTNYQVFFECMQQCILMYLKNYDLF